jgi:hypothetical protein
MKLRARASDAVVSVAKAIIRIDAKGSGGAKLLGKLVPGGAKVLESAAPVLKTVGKVGGKLATGIGVAVPLYEMYNAKTRVDKVQAGLDTAAAGAGFLGPVGAAFSAGYAGGQLLDQGIGWASKKVVGTDLSPSALISGTLHGVEDTVAKHVFGQDPESPTYRNLGSRINDYFGL